MKIKRIARWAWLLAAGPMLWGHPSRAAGIAGDIMGPAFGAQVRVTPPDHRVTVAAGVLVTRVGLKGGEAGSGVTRIVDLDGRTVAMQWQLSEEMTPARVRRTAEDCMRRLLDARRAGEQHRQGLTAPFGTCMYATGLRLGGAEAVMPAEIFFRVSHRAKEGMIGATSVVTRPGADLAATMKDLRSCFEKSQANVNPVETSALQSPSEEFTFISIAPLSGFLDQCMQDAGYAVKPLRPASGG